MSERIVTVTVHYAEYRGDHSTDMNEIVDVPADTPIGVLVRGLDEQMDSRGIHVDWIEIWPRRRLFRWEAAADE